MIRMTLRRLTRDYPHGSSACVSVENRARPSLARDYARRRTSSGGFWRTFSLSRFVHSCLRQVKDSCSAASPSDFRFPASTLSKSHGVVPPLSSVLSDRDETP